MANRTFDIDNDVAFQNATLVFPSFCQGKKQLSLLEVEIYRLLRLQGQLPITLLKHKNDAEDFHLFTVGCSLINLSPSIVYE